MLRQLAPALLAIAACAAPGSGTLDDNLGPHGNVGQLHDQNGVGHGSGGGGMSLRVRVAMLTADEPDVAAHLDADLVNAWGVAVDPEPATGPEFWIAANGTDSSQIVAADGTPTGQVVAVPTAPTGVVYTESTELDGDEFIFATEAGGILGWQDQDGERAMLRVDDSASGAVYKGLAAIEFCAGHTSVAATDFHNGSVDVYGPGYAEVDHPGFVDDQLPAGFAPFGIAALGGEVYVSYAKQDADAHDDVAGPGNGFVDVFAMDGTLARRLIAGGHLDSPWGMAIAPAGMGKLSNKLLVGNFGDGMINVYDPRSGAWLGALADETGAPLVIDGLWTVMVGPKTDAADLSDRLFFAAGPSDESHGRFGSLTPVM